MIDLNIRELGIGLAFKSMETLACILIAERAASCRICNPPQQVINYSLELRSEKMSNALNQVVTKNSLRMMRYILQQLNKKWVNHDNLQLCHLIFKQKLANNLITFPSFQISKKEYILHFIWNITYKIHISLFVLISKYQNFVEKKTSPFSVHSYIG